MSGFNGSAQPHEHAMRRVSDTELRLARLWAELLKLRGVGLDEDYFDLGGNSLLAVNLMARSLTQFGVKLPVSSIIEAPTVSQFAGLLQSPGSYSPLVVIRNGGKKTPCSWFTTPMARRCSIAAWRSCLIRN